MIWRPNDPGHCGYHSWGGSSREHQCCLGEGEGERMQNIRSVVVVALAAVVVDMAKQHSKDRCFGGKP